MSLFPNSHTTSSAKYLSVLKGFNILNPFNKGLVFGNFRISVKRALQNVLIVGAVGTNKTSSYLVPSLMKMRNCSMHVLDPSQELFNLTSKALSRHFKIHCINLIDITNSDYWNPLQTATTQDDMVMISDAIISSAYPNEESGDSKFWNDGAKLLISILLNSILHASENKTLHHIYTLLHRFNENDKEALTKELSRTLDADSWLAYKSIIAQPERILGSQITTAKVALAPFSSSVLKTVSSKSTIDFASFRKERKILYICIAEHRIKELGIYASLLFREMMETYMKMPKKEDLVQYIFCEEGGNIYVPKLNNYITVLRKRKVSVSIILQSIRQLYALYGKDADTIIENTVTHLYYPGLSLKTCQEISQKIGMTSRPSSFKYFPTNKKNSATKSPLLSPESIRTLKNGRGLFLSGNLPATILRLKPWFKRFWMRLKLKK